MRRILTLLAAVLLAVSLSSCETGESNGQSAERQSRQGTYEQVVRNQPAAVMPYSPTRNTINRWAEVWGKPGVLAYTYLTTGIDADQAGYYVFEGPPVSYCVSITPTYDLVDAGSESGVGDLVVPAPGIDSAYYSGGECNTYYGIDAVTGQIVTFNVGFGQNMAYFSEPSTRYPNAEPLADATIESAKKQ